MVEKIPEDTADIRSKVEAILMVVEEPIALVTLATAVSTPVDAVHQALEQLREEYDGNTDGRVRGFELREIAGGWRFYVREEFDHLVQEYVYQQSPSRLSQAALETLAVIAYRQPISRGAISAIRAVNVDSVVRTLLSRGLIEEGFADPETGAIHYVTTDALLTHLGIQSLDELPAIAPLLPDNPAELEEPV